jgi:hypothetical protein
MGESMWSRPATGSGVVPERFRPPAAAPTTPCRQNATRTLSLVEMRYEPGVMGPYGPTDPEDKGHTKGAPKGQDPAVQDWSQFQPTTAKGTPTPRDRARSLGRGLLPRASSMWVTPFLPRGPPLPTVQSPKTLTPVTKPQGDGHDGGYGGD